MSADIHWVKLAQQGDEAAFEELVHLYQKPIYNLILRMTGRPEDAEELTQTAFLNAWRGLPRFQAEASFFTWLYRLAKNAVIDFLRHEGRRHQILSATSLDDEDSATSDIPDDRQNPERQLLRRDLHAALYRALEELSPEHQEILVQRELDGLSYYEIADMQGLELGTVKSRISRARLALRQVLLAQGNYLERDTSDHGKNKKGGEG